MVLVLNFIAKLSSLNSNALLACGAAAMYAIVLWHCLLAGACEGLSNVRCCSLGIFFCVLCCSHLRSSIVATALYVVSGVFIAPLKFVRLESV